METTPIDEYFNMKSGLTKLAEIPEDASPESKPGDLMQMLLALMRTVYSVHQHSHWKSSGPAFYSSHLLFERLYNNAAERVDSLAEKTIGLFGPNSLDHKAQLGVMSNMAEDFISDNHLENSLKAELMFIEKATEVYKKLKEIDSLSPGSDDLLMSSISQAETAVYLLKQCIAKFEV